MLTRTAIEFKKVKEPKIGEKYHLSWAHPGCVWRLVKFNGNGTCVLVTPKTKREIIGKVDDLRHLRDK